MFDTIISLTDPNNIDTLPQETEAYYVITGSGLYQWKPTLLGDSLAPCKEWPAFLSKLPDNEKNGVFWYKAPPIPSKIMDQAFSFFRAVWLEQQTEVGVYLLYNEEIENPDDRWALHVPKQVVTGVSVDYILEISEIDDDYSLVGTIHSHCDFGAFHSGTDEADVEYFMGVHITIGNVDRDTPSIEAMTYSGKTRWPYNVEIVADTSNLTGGAAFPEEWLSRVQSLSNIDIKPEDFPSLPEAIVKKWLALFKPVTTKKTLTYPNAQYDADDDESWRWWNSAPKIKKNKGGEKWSYELRSYAPKEFFRPSGQISDEFFIDAAEGALGFLQEAMAERGLTLKWKIDIDDSSDDSDTIEQAIIRQFESGDFLTFGE